MKTVRLTTAAGDRPLPDRPANRDRRREAPLFPGVFAIFGHGNVTCLGLGAGRGQRRAADVRGQNEQGMALAAIGYAKAMRGRQIMVATSSDRPGRDEHGHRRRRRAWPTGCPSCCSPATRSQSRIPDPVLQQVEHFGEPSTTVNDAFRAVTRYWDRITHPEQVASRCRCAVATMLDPADCGPAFLGLPQDVQAEAYDYPERFFEPARPRAPPASGPTARELAAAAAASCEARSARSIVAGGGVHYSLAEAGARRASPRRTASPSSRPWRASRRCRPTTRCNVGPIGVTGCDHANRLAAEADVVLAVGTRLQDFTTGSWTVFAHERPASIGLNAARFDAVKHLRAAGRRRRPRGPHRARRGARRLAAPSRLDGRAPDERGGYGAFVAASTAAGGRRTRRPTRR